MIKYIIDMKKSPIVFLILMLSNVLISNAKTLITSASQVGFTNSIQVTWGETDVTINPPSVALNRYQIIYKPIGGSATTIDNISNSLRTYTITGLNSALTL